VAIRDIAASLEERFTLDFETDGFAALFQKNDMS
jgi:hypothetical protein